MIRVVVGVLIGVAAVLAAAFLLPAGPNLDVTVEVPETGTVSASSHVRVEAFNPHTETVTLQDIVFGEAMLERFEFRPLAPPNDAMTLLGETSWPLGYSVPPRTSRIVRFTLLPKFAGHQVVEFSVCTAEVSCTAFARTMAIAAQ